MTKHVDVALLPSELSGMEADCAVVVDCLRATTTLAMLFAAGVTDVVVTQEFSAARARAANDGGLLAGEVGGVKPAGFHLGNSPIEFEAEMVHGKRVIQFTTNGTLAVCAATKFPVVVTGSVANLAAAAAFARAYERVVVVCAGDERGTRFSLEDFAAAGAICRAIAVAERSVRLGDAAAAASRLGLEVIAESTHAGTLRALGFERDIQFARRPDSSNSVPRVEESGSGWALLRDASLQK